MADRRALGENSDQLIEKDDRLIVEWRYSKNKKQKGSAWIRSTNNRCSTRDINGRFPAIIDSVLLAYDRAAWKIEGISLGSRAPMSWLFPRVQDRVVRLPLCVFS